MKSVPHDSTLGKNYVDKVFQKTKQALRQIISDNWIYIHVDETTDSCGRYVANLIRQPGDVKPVYQKKSNQKLMAKQYWTSIQGNK